jgi:hypothetical protein
LRELLEPVNDWLSEKEKATAVSRTGLETKKSVYEKRAETLRKAAAAADNEADLERLIKESAEFAAMAAEIEVPPEPKLYSGGDATSEGMAKELRKHGGRLSIMTDEGKQLSIIAGRYTADQAPDVELYLKATHGGIADSIRATSKTINVVDPEIAMLQCVQPTVLFNMRNSSTLRGQGFFARCYPVLPESMVGYRTARPGDLDEEVRAAYHDLIKTILDVEEQEPGDHRLIRMSDEADRWVLYLQQWVEGRCAPGKAYSENLEWVSKFIGYTVRIAAYLKIAEWAAAEDRCAAEGLEIDAATMKSAIKYA